MDWIGTAVAIVAVVIAALGVMAALLSTSAQLHQERLAREVDFYRTMTPFLSFEVVHDAASDAPPAVNVYADGGGYAFNVLANIDQTNASSPGGFDERCTLNPYLRLTARDDSESGLGIISFHEAPEDP